MGCGVSRSDDSAAPLLTLGCASSCLRHRRPSRARALGSRSWAGEASAGPAPAATAQPSPHVCCSCGLGSRGTHTVQDSSIIPCAGVRVTAQVAPEPPLALQPEGFNSILRELGSCLPILGDGSAQTRRSRGEAATDGAHTTGAPCPLVLEADAQDAGVGRAGSP